MWELNRSRDYVLVNRFIMILVVVVVVHMASWAQ